MAALVPTEKPGLFAMAKSWLGFGGGLSGGMEGMPRGPFYGHGENGGSFPFDVAGDGWQRNIGMRDWGGSSLPSTMSGLYRNSVSQCLALHIQETPGGGWKEQRQSAPALVLRRPNEYETRPLFLSNIVGEMMLCGESLAFAIRDDRGAVSEMHRVPYGSWSVHIEPESRAIFYNISTDNQMPWEHPTFMIPARDAAHFRLHTPRHPLIGESPIKNLSLALGINVALNQSQLAFFSQMNRPSGVMTTDEKLTVEQMRQLRAAFEEQAKAWQAGGMPILASGLKFQPVAIAANDSQLIEQQKMTVVDVARAYGIPMALLAESSGPQGGTEALISHWLSVGLGSVLESIERTLDRLFRFDGHNQIQLDPSPLLRADMDARISSLVKAVQGGIMTPDEARAKERMAPIEGGDEAFMQRQNVPLSLLTGLHRQELEQAMKPPPAEPQPEPEPEPEADAEVSRALVIDLMSRKRANG